MNPLSMKCQGKVKNGNYSLPDPKVTSSVQIRSDQQPKTKYLVSVMIKKKNIDKQQILTLESRLTEINQ